MFYCASMLRDGNNFMGMLQKILDVVREFVVVSIGEPPPHLLEQHRCLICSIGEDPDEATWANLLRRVNGDWSDKQSITVYISMELYTSLLGQGSSRMDESANQQRVHEDLLC